MDTVAAKLPRALTDEIDRLVKSRRFANRSEVLRVAVRQFVEGGARPATDADEIRRKMIDAFRRRLRELAQDPRYRHRWVALHNGELLDADDDEDALLRRVLDRDEDPIHIGYATEEPAPRRILLPGVRVRRQS